MAGADETREWATRWAAVWARAWRTHDAELLREVYAADCVFRSHPFREPAAGIEGVLAYVRWAFSTERTADPWLGEPLVDGDRALVEYRAEVVGTDGSAQTIAGCSLLRFGADGRVDDERDYWAIGEGHRRPPESPRPTAAPASPPG